ncbi:hypothetical protein QTO30_04120 [Yoonia sp. GPGPB17]|uniref:hypothetical protein n=1 Tax=Yoonia sp. GPGPB17 TaxID=3026147 RepID=UPI0030C2F4E7
MIRNLAAAIFMLPVAATADGMKIELNGVSVQEGACRLVFTAESDAGVEGLVLETALFDTSGAVLLLTLFDFVDLPAGNLRVRQFDIADQPCAEVGRILFNGIESCAGMGCDAPLSVASRVEAVEVLG